MYYILGFLIGIVLYVKSNEIFEGLKKIVPVFLSKKEKQLAREIYGLFVNAYSRCEPDWDYSVCCIGFWKPERLIICDNEINVGVQTIYNKKIIKWLKPKIEKLEKKRIIKKDRMSTLKHLEMIKNKLENETKEII